MKLTIQNTARDGVIDFINDMLVVAVDNKFYPAMYEFKGNETVLYSLPSNDAHIPYTKSKSIDIGKIIKDKPERIPLLKKWWSPFKKGDKVTGIIRNETFIINR